MDNELIQRLTKMITDLQHKQKSMLGFIKWIDLNSIKKDEYYVLGKIPYQYNKSHRILKYYGYMECLGTNFEIINSEKIVGKKVYKISDDSIKKISEYIEENNKKLKKYKKIILHLQNNTPIKTNSDIYITYINTVERIKNGKQRHDNGKQRRDNER